MADLRPPPPEAHVTLPDFILKKSAPPGGWALWAGREGWALSNPPRRVRYWGGECHSTPEKRQAGKWPFSNEIGLVGKHRGPKATPSWGGVCWHPPFFEVITQDVLGQQCWHFMSGATFKIQLSLLASVLCLRPMSAPFNGRHWLWPQGPPFRHGPPGCSSPCML